MIYTTRKALTPDLTSWAALYHSGFSAEEIADLYDCPLAFVRDVITLVQTYGLHIQKEVSTKKRTRKTT